MRARRAAALPGYLAVWARWDGPCAYAPWMSHPVEKETHMLVSVVVPVYNEEEVLLQFHRRLAAALATVEMDVEIIYVNDGSADHTLPALHQLRDADDRVAILHLSRNFGEEIAMTAGL